MKNARIIVKRCWIFLLCFLIAYGALSIALCFGDKATLHLWFNQCHTSFFDNFFKYYTYLAEYGPYVLAFCLLFYRISSASFVLASELSAGLVVQLLKRLFMAPRPMVFFDLANHPDALPLVEGVSLNSTNSFPSGHASTFTVMFLCISLILGSKRLNLKKSTVALFQVLCFAMAILGAYSRIYLSQHFASDVLAGACIGLVMTIVMATLFTKLKQRHPSFYHWRIRV